MKKVLMNYKNMGRCEFFLLRVFVALILNQAFYLYAQEVDSEDYDIKVVILGSGMPVPNDTQFGASILVEAGGQPYVFDCGRGCGIRLGQIYGNRNYGKVDTVFITHLHSDHTLGLPEVYINGWTQQRLKPFRVWGPVTTKALMENIKEAYEGDILLRVDPNGGPEEISGLEQQVTEFSGDGVLLEENGVRITAFTVNHGPVKPAFGYRLDYKGRSVVISGDTAPSENLLKYSQGADLLLHEVIPPDMVENIMRYVKDKATRDLVLSIHTTAEQASNIFSKVKPELAAYYHYNEGESNTVERIISDTRKGYNGPLVVGHDLMTITIGDEIKVNEKTSGNDFTTFYLTSPDRQVALQARYNF